MTTPKIAKALSNLDDELIAAAAEEQAAPRLLTKKKVLALLAACLLLVGTFTMMGTAPKPVGPTPEELKAEYQHWFDDMIEMYQDDPEMLAYYTKWREIDISASPYPDEWKNKDGSMKDFVTTAMLYEAFYDSLQYQFIMEDPSMHRGWNASVNIYMDEDRFVHMTTGVVTYQATYDEQGNLLNERGEK